MSVRRRTVAADPDRVWAVLSDGWLFSGWVVGASHIRLVEPEWPAVGARLHHSVGSWPIMVSDTTQVLECSRGRRLVLQARAWPFGEARVEIELSATDQGCRVTMTETPTNGPARWLHNPLQDKALDARNQESLARLADMVEGGAAEQAAR